MANLNYPHFQDLANYTRTPGFQPAARPDESAPIHCVNIAVIGDRGVGKTSLCQVDLLIQKRYLRHLFNRRVL